MQTAWSFIVKKRPVWWGKSQGITDYLPEGYSTVTKGSVRAVGVGRKENLSFQDWWGW